MAQYVYKDAMGYVVSLNFEGEDYDVRTDSLEMATLILNGK